MPMNNDPTVNAFAQFGHAEPAVPMQVYGSNPQGLDPTIVNMARAIKSVETSGVSNPYQARGKSGEYGAYQYTPETWAADSTKYLGQAVPLEGSTIAQQNQVAYGKISDLKAQGYNPSQVASIWNSGKPDPTGNVGTNSQGVHFDTPQYSESVVNAYNQFKSGQMATPQPTSSTVGAKTSPGDQNAPQDDSLGSELTGRLQNASNALNQAVGGQINPLSGVLQVAGQGAGAINDIIGKGLELIPGVKPLEGLLGKGASKLAQTGAGQAVMNTWNDFAAKHPEAAGDIGAVGNVVTLVPIFKGFGLAKEAVGGAIAKAIGKDALSEVIADVAPKETAKTLAQGIAKNGVKKSLIRGTITPVVDDATRNLAQTVVDNVPGFTKAGTLAGKIGLTQDTIDAMVSDLKNQVEKSGSSKIYSFKELRSYLSAVPKPLGVVKDTEGIIDRVKNAALDIAQKNGGKISSLFDARKEFDALISQQFPNLYTNPAETPIRIAVRNIRNAMTQFTADNLPDVELKNSLKLQSKLIDAVENMSQKIVSGPTKELGTTRLGRLAAKHPVVTGLLKKGAKAGVTAAGAGAGYELYKDLTQ